jgi:hypothetical protein
MLIDHKVDVRIWKNERTMGMNGERVVVKSYSMKLFVEFHLEVPLSKALQSVWHWFWRRVERLTTHLDWKKTFLKENLMVFCLFNSFAFDPFQSFRSLVVWILLWIPNFISLLHWNNFLKEKLIALCFLFQKKTKSPTSTQSYRLFKPPHHKNDTWNLCLMNLLHLVICNDKCWKWKNPFDNYWWIWVLNWMQVMPCANFGFKFFVLVYCWIFTKYYYRDYTNFWCFWLAVYGLRCKAKNIYYNI